MLDTPNHDDQEPGRRDRYALWPTDELPRCFMLENLHENGWKLCRIEIVASDGRRRDWSGEQWLDTPCVPNANYAYSGTPWTFPEVCRTDALWCWSDDSNTLSSVSG